RQMPDLTPRDDPGYSGPDNPSSPVAITDSSQLPLLERHQLESYDARSRLLLVPLVAGCPGPVSVVENCIDAVHCRVLLSEVEKTVLVEVGHDHPVARGAYLLGCSEGPVAVVDQHVHFRPRRHDVHLAVLVDVTEGNRGTSPDGGSLRGPERAVATT